MQPLWLCIHLGPLILQTLIALCIFQALDIADVNNFFPFWLSELQIALLGKASMQKICYISHRLSHYHHVRFACASSDVFQRELHNYTRQKQAWRLQICTIGNDALCVKGDNISLPKRKLLRKKRYVLKVGSEILVESETILTTPSSSGLTKSRLS